jgi:hypothetical protein
MMRITSAILVALCLAACDSPSDDSLDVSVDALVSDGGTGPLGEWVWHDVPGTMCANGSPTGIGINRGTGSKVVIYMSGGSACLDSSCSIGTPSMRKNGGFGAAQLSACVQGNCDGSVTFPSKSIFNRTPAGASPFTDATYVFISNCSGDYYVGDKDHAFSSWTAHFHGSRNQQLIAAALATWFPATSRVVLTGGSAGAVGALQNYWQWVAAFPTTRVDLIADSYAFVFNDGPQWRYSLHNPQVPPGCPTCATDYRTVYAFNANLAPSSRIAILDSENNYTLDFASGYQYTQGLAALQPLLDALPNTKYHVADGNVHILMQYALDSTATDIFQSFSVKHYLSDFLAKMQSNDPTWTSHSSVQ